MPLPRTLWYLSRDLKPVTITQRELLSLCDCLVILGEAGMGKSTLLEELAAAQDAALCTARQLINRPDPRSLLGNASLLARLIHDGPAVGYSAPALPLGA